MRRQLGTDSGKTNIHSEDKVSGLEEIDAKTKQNKKKLRTWKISGAPTGSRGWEHRQCNHTTPTSQVHNQKMILQRAALHPAPSPNRTTAALSAPHRNLHFCCRERRGGRKQSHSLTHLQPAERELQESDHRGLN